MLILFLLPEKMGRNISGCSKGIRLSREVANDEEAPRVVCQDLAIFVNDDHRLNTHVVVLCMYV